MSSLDKIDKWGLNYIRKTRFYLELSAFFPIYIVIVGIINFVFLTYVNITSIESQKVIPIHAIIVFTSFVLIFVFSLLQFLFLRKWNIKIKEYNKRIKTDNNRIFNYEDEKNHKNLANKPSLTDIFYDVLNHMEKIRILFIFLNIVSIIYIFYNIMIFIRLFVFLKAPIIMTFNIIRYLNISVAIVLVSYLIYMWYHFTKWNIKLKKIKNYEKMVTRELNL